MSRFYANLTVQGPEQADVATYLTAAARVAYVSPTIKACTVIYHEDLGEQEDLTAAVSRHFHCPALLVMAYNDTILLYQLYADGERTDSYVSSPHEELDLGGEAAPEGNAEVLCSAFGMEHATARVERVLRRPTHPTKGYALAVNRHGELARALGLPLFAAGAGYSAIEIGELPAGQGFHPSDLVKIAGR